MKLLHTWSYIYIDHSTVWELLFLFFMKICNYMNICGHVSLVYVNIRNVGHGTGVDVLSHAGTGGVLLFDTLDLRLFHGLGALVVVFHDFSPRKQTYEHATWHRCWCPASYKWLFVVWNFDYFVCDLNSSFECDILTLQECDILTLQDPPPPNLFQANKQKKNGWVS